MGFRATVQAQESKLTPAEQRIAMALLSDPTVTTTWPAAQVAAETAVHESTVTRLAQKLGYRGYADLRADLQRDAHQISGSAVRARARVAKAHELSRLVEDEISALDKLPDHVTQESLDAAAKSLLMASRVFIFGANHAVTLVEFMDRRLRRIGLDAVPLRYQGRDLAERVATLSSKDVVLAFAFKEQPPGLGDLLRHAHAIDAPTILVTDPPGILMRPSPRHLLAAPRGADQDFHTLIVPLAICYALQLSLTNLDPERFGAAMEKVETLARAYSEHVGDDFEAPARGMLR